MASKEQKNKDQKKEKETAKKTSSIKQATTDIKSSSASTVKDNKTTKEKPTKPKEAHSASPLVKRCGCKHQYQDSVYGEQMRLCTPQKAATGVNYKCTVCSSITKN